MTTRRVAGTALFAVAFVVMGLPDFAHGVAWPAMRADLDRPLADLGLFLVASAAGYLVVALLTGRLAARWTIDGFVARSVAACAVGLALIALAPGWWAVVVGGALVGGGSGGMDTGFNAAVALQADGRLMGLLHAGYGVGAALGPLVVGASLAAADEAWRPPYALFALATAAVLAPVATRSLGEAPAQETMGSPRGMFLPCATFAVYVGLEVTVGQWAFTYLTEVRDLGELLAAALVAAYWVGLTAGRLWLGLRGHQLAVDRVLLASVALAVASGALLWLGGPASPAGLPLAGVALSVVFPLLMLVTPARVGEARAAAAVGWQIAASSLGGAAAPAVSGVVLDAAGVDAYGPITLVLAVLLGICVVALEVGPRGSPADAVVRTPDAGP